MASTTRHAATATSSTDSDSLAVFASRSLYIRPRTLAPCENARHQVYHTYGLSTSSVLMSAFSASRSAGRSPCSCSCSSTRVPSEAMRQCLMQPLISHTTQMLIPEADSRDNLLPVAHGLERVLEIAPKICVELLLRDELEEVRVEAHLERIASGGHAAEDTGHTPCPA